MSLEKNVTIDGIIVESSGFIQIRTKIVVLEDGKEVATSFDNRLILPGDDYSGEDARVQAICAATHTAEVIAAYEAAQAAVAPEAP